MAFIKRYRWDLSCILVIGLISIFVVQRNFKTGYSLIGGDVGAVQEYPVSAFKEALYVWFDRDNTGSQFGVNPSSLFPYLALLAFLKFLGFSAVFGQRIFFFSMFFISGISSYYMIRTLIHVSHLTALAGSFFYMFNHYTMVSWSSAISNYSYTYMFMPILIALYIKGIDTGNNRYAVLLALTTIAGLGGNLSLIGIVFIALALYLIYYIIMEKRVYAPVWFSVKTFIFSIFFNMWWWLPTLVSIRSLAENVQARGHLGWIEWMNSRTSFLNLFRLDGYTGWIESFPYGPNFSNKPIIIFIGYAITILCISSIFWIKKYKKSGYFLMLVIISLFLAKGRHDPFGGIFLMFFKYIPGFSIFRSSYDKFIPLAAVGYAYLVSIAIYEIGNILKKYRYRLSEMWIGTTIFIILVYPYPFCKGNLIRTKPDDRKTFFVKVPVEYDNASKWMNANEGEFRIFAIPQKKGDYIDYDWGYFGPSIDRYLYDKPVVMETFFKDVGWVFEKAKSISSILKLISTKYILFHFDNINKREAYRLEEFTKKDKEIRLEKDFEKIRFYLLTKEDFLPIIYTIGKGILVENRDDKSKCLTYLANHGLIDGRPAIIFDSDNEEKLPKDCMEEIILCNKNKYDSDIDQDSIRAVNLLWDRRDKFIKADFYALKDSVYNIKADILSNFIPYYREKNILFNSNIGEEKGLKDWLIGIRKAEYNLKGICGMLYANLFFRENGKKDEYIQMKRQKLNIDLDKAPFFEMTYMVMDPRVQTIQVVLGLDFDDDGKIDGYLKNIFEVWAPAFLKKYIYAAKENAINIFPSREKYKVIYMEIYPHKKWGIDCSRGWKNRYKFYIANLKFCDFTEKREFFEERKYAMDIDYNTEGHELREESGFSNGRIYKELSQDINGINLKKFPSINFCSTGHWDHINRVEVILELDFDGDGKKDKEETALFLYSIPNAGRQEFDLNLKDIIRYKYRGKKYIGLVKIKWIIYCRKDYKETRGKGLFLFKINHLKVFSRRLIDPIGKEISIPIFNFNNNDYAVSKYFADRNDFDNIELKVNRVRITKGWHTIYSLLGKDNNFKIDSISIAEEKLDLKANPAGEIIRWKKINPARYEISLDADIPFWLVFNETFNNGWRAFLDRGKRIEVRNHYKVNGYANGWYVNKIKNKKSKIKNKEVQIVIEYLPQEWFKLGCIVSCLSILGGLVYIWRRR